MHLVRSQSSKYLDKWINLVQNDLNQDVKDQKYEDLFTVFSFTVTGLSHSVVGSLSTRLYFPMWEVECLISLIFANPI